MKEDNGESMQLSSLSRSTNAGIFPALASCKESQIEEGNGQSFQLSNGEASAFSVAARKARDLGMQNNQAETNSQAASLSPFANSGGPSADGSTTSWLAFGIPLIPNIPSYEADAPSSIAAATKGAPQRPLFGLQDQKEKAFDEDLDALADKIKRILQEEARRHGIDI
jgi:hypothetical protein